MSRVITNSELQSHNTRKSIWIVIKNDVYDVTAYLNEHPGGEDPLLDAAGHDATAAFEDVGHSSDARSLMRKYKIGTLAKGESCSRLRPRKWMSSSQYHRNCTECDALSDSPVLVRSQQCVELYMMSEECGKTKDKSTSRSSVRSTSSNKARHSRSNPCTPVMSSTKTNLPIGRVPSIVVPRQRRGDGPCRKRAPESGSSSLKWAVLALAAAIIIGVAYKKYAS